MLADKVIIVTGGAGLLGKVFIEGIIENQGIAVIAELDEVNGKHVQEKLRMQYGKDKATFVKVDITSQDSLQRMIDSINKSYGRIDALVNNAYPRNKNFGRQFFNVSYSDFCQNMNIHLGGYFLASQQIAKYFINQGYGNIINIASIYGVIAPRFEIYDETDMTMPVEYAVIKSSLIHLTKYMAKYLKGKNIRVNSISPGGIFDNQPETFVNAYKSYSLSKGMLDKTDIVGSLLFLLSDGSKYINGQNLIIDDGFIL
jgi:NAD(P)-dependent dehydrogenase (short-subunit alcohol dehydrogenase family)